VKTHYTIPIFIPEKACPFRCIYCNQYNITNHHQIIDLEEINSTIQQYLRTFPQDGMKRIAFFGGTFTGMSLEEQNYYLDAVQPYLQSGKIESIQLSTRPDYINEPILENLKKHGVHIIELGAQSLDEEVLQFSGRGHTVKDVEKASQLINSYGFTLGLQMMVGLPFDTIEKTKKTARQIVDFGAKCTRIYPTLVIKDTFLEKLYKNGHYQPLTIEQAIDYSIAAMEIFEAGQVTVLRVGLHPSEGLINGTQLVAGPFHVSFKELVMTEQWHRRFLPFLQPSDCSEIAIAVPHEQLNAAIGYEARNKKELLQYYNKVEFFTDDIE
jgi:histone acetyltransferase (RNA polymerase elongator complex component)